ncbi:MAG: 4-hydroxy-3-methylbut-2-enyl diphosphate reductase [candidate division WOR-3 bacterium]|nr:4-hydroxy-3-methylbut-2-enyl diphosphate reductase [candidate division WOR-3 bacterium]
MKIIIAKDMGFCFGVKRAIKIARDTRKKTDENVWTLGSIIHNPQVVEKLKGEGIVPANGLDEIDSGYVIIRSHGACPEVLQEIRKRGFTVVDATCPLVKRAQERARKLSNEGYETFAIGDKEHPEIMGIVGQTEGRIQVIDTRCDWSIDEKEKVGLIAQTTQSLEILEKVIQKILPKVKELRVFNTICDVTNRRQKEVKKLARGSDLMIVIGGRKSANTSRLASIAREEGCKTYHIEQAEELKGEWFAPKSKVGVTAGASTPDWIIKEVVSKLEQMDKKEEILHGRRIRSRD